eukprot:9747878-Lingulodinium_polyedra.AAC.1
MIRSARTGGAKDNPLDLGSQSRLWTTLRNGASTPIRLLLGPLGPRALLIGPHGPLDGPRELL